MLYICVCSKPVHILSMNCMQSTNFVQRRLGHHLPKESRFAAQEAAEKSPPHRRRGRRRRRRRFFPSEMIFLSRRARLLASCWRCGQENGARKPTLSGRVDGDDSIASHQEIPKSLAACSIMRRKLLQSQLATRSVYRKTSIYATPSATT